jgi:hypothetical protein
MHCNSYSYSYSLACNGGQCIWTAFDNNILQYTPQYNNNPQNIPVNSISFPKYDLLESEMVRIDSNGEFADSAKMRADKKQKFGYSFRLRLRQPPEPNSRLKVEKHVIFVPYDIGRRSARSGAKAIQDFIENGEETSFSYSKTKNITFIGIAAILTGIVSFISSLVFGRWSEQPRRSKKSS